MRHELVTRAALGLCTLLLCAALLFARITAPASQAAPPDREPADDPGAALFALHCAGCHETAEMVDVLNAGSDRASAEEDMRSFLAAHGGSSAEEDRAIVAWLARTARSGR